MSSQPDRKCCCRHDDARECVLARYPGDRRVADDPDEVCYCRCHQELADELREQAEWDYAEHTGFYEG